MPSTGLRELKKARTRRLIADTAARLFAERGYEHVAVSDVAREAEVAEQTVYNYFRTKEQLVTDREQQIQDRLGDLIRSRPPAITAAAAIRDFVLKSVAGIRSIPPELWRGELGYLAAISPAVHRLALELTDRQAAALAAVINDTTAVPPEVAKLQGIALAGVFQIIISEAACAPSRARARRRSLTSCIRSLKTSSTSSTAGSAFQNRRHYGNRAAVATAIRRNAQDLWPASDAIAGRLRAAPGCGPGCPRDRGRRSRESRTAARSAPGRPRLRRPAPSRRCR